MIIDRKLQAAHPKEPWLWRRDWSEKRLTHSHLLDGVGLLAFAVAWVAVITPAAYFVFTGEQPQFLKWILGLFAILGALLLFGAVRSVITGIRYPRSALVLNSVPQRLGQKFRAQWEAARIPPGDILTFMTCTRGTNKQQRTIWREEREVPRSSIHQTASGWVAPVEFDLPPRGEETAELDTPNQIAWHVGVAVRRDNVATISASFLIPVFGGKQAEPTGEFEALLAELPDDIRRKIEADIDATNPRSGEQAH